MWSRFFWVPFVLGFTRRQWLTNDEDSELPFSLFTKTGSHATKKVAFRASSNFVNFYWDDVMKQGSHVCFYFFAWMSHGFKISCHTSAQLAGGLKTLGSLLNSSSLLTFRYELTSLSSEGKRHDAAMLANSNLLNVLEQYAVSPTGQTMCIYGDPTYPLRVNLMAPFRGAALTAQLQQIYVQCTNVCWVVVWRHCWVFQVYGL